MSVQPPDTETSLTTLEMPAVVSPLQLPALGASLELCQPILFVSTSEGLSDLSSVDLDEAFSAESRSRMFCICGLWKRIHVIEHDTHIRVSAQSWQKVCWQGKRKGFVRLFRTKTGLWSSKCLRRAPKESPQDGQQAKWRASSMSSR